MIELESVCSSLVVSQQVKNVITINTTAKTEPTRNTFAMSILWKVRGIRCISRFDPLTNKMFQKTLSGRRLFQTRRAPVSRHLRGEKLSPGGMRHFGIRV